MDWLGSAALTRPADRFSAGQRQRRKAILVVGMSRSGTSMIAHVLHTLGAGLPDDLVGPGPGNPLGHWEPRALVAINDEILISLGRTWDDPRPLPDGWFQTGQSRFNVARIRRQIERDYAGAQLLVIKDPRLCRLLPLYSDALDSLDIDLTVLLQVRPVAEVVLSLAERDGKHPALSELCWLRSVTEAEWHSRNCPRVWLSFGQVAADWRDCIRRVGRVLDVEWPIHPEDAAPRVAALLKSGRPCEESSCGASDPGAALPARAWEAVQAGLANNEPVVRAEFDTIRATLGDADRLYMPMLLAAVQRHQGALRAMQESTSWRLTAPLRALKQWAEGRADRGDGAGRFNKNDRRRKADACRLPPAWEPVWR